MPPETVGVTITLPAHLLREAVEKEIGNLRYDIQGYAATLEHKNARITELVATVGRLKACLIASGVDRELVDRLEKGDAPDAS